MSRSQVSVSGVGITVGAVLCVLVGGMGGATLGKGDATVVYSPPTTTTVTSTLTERVAIFTDNTTEVQTVTVTAEPADTTAR